jgi:iron complex outermembrane recepter protein
MKPRNPIALLIGWIALAMAPNHAVGGASGVGAPSAAVAQGGVIEGRVFNPSSGEYLRNAEVRGRGAEISSVTQSDGCYRLVNVPEGNVTLRASYTG